MKKSRTFLRAFLMSSVILLCFSIIYLGMLFAYEGIRRNGFGEEVSAVEITREHIKFLDFVIK